ncbi:hypothetical protein BDW66DRAFT_126446 [Aspergillus desertorum]
MATDWRNNDRALHGYSPEDEQHQRLVEGLRTLSLPDTGAAAGVLYIAYWVYGFRYSIKLPLCVSGLNMHLYY